MQRAGAWTAVWAPISLALTGAMLESDGHEIKLVDCIVENISGEQLKKITADFNPHLAVLNTATPSISHDLATASIIKSAAPKSKTVAFGIHVTVLTDDSFSLEKGKKLDGVVRGEPEAAIRDLVHNRLEFAGVSGFSWRKGDEIVHEADRAPIDMNELPTPAWHLIKQDRYIMPFTNRRFLLVATGRGCPYHCTFCADTAFYGRKLRLRNPDTVALEIEEITRRFGIRDFLFWSESFTLDRNYALSVCKNIVNRGLHVGIVVNSRVDNVDMELLTALKEAGCWIIGYGVESGSDEILKSMRKGTTTEQTSRALEMTAKAHIGAVAHCVLGYPGETEKDVLRTIELVKRLKLDFAQFYCAVPFPGSKLYEEAKLNGWLTTTDWSRFEQNYSVLDTPWLKAQRVMELRTQAFKEFYLRPRAFLNTFKYMRNPAVALRMMKMLYDFWGWI